MEYFANEKREEDLLAELTSRIDSYYNYLNSSGRVNLAKRAFKEYYINKYDAPQVTEDREGRPKINVAELQNSVQYTMSLIANQQAAYTPLTVNSDSKSQYQTKVSRNILDYYTEVGEMDSKQREALEMAIVTTECHGVLGWDPKGGEDYGVTEVEEGEEKREEVVPQGDITFSYHDITDIIRDVSNRKQGNNDWYIIRRQINKFELAARYPKFKDKITNLKTEMDELKELNYDTQVLDQNSEMVYFYEFRHAKTLVVPEGKRVIFINEQILDKGKLPYPNLLVFKIAPKKELVSNFSWSNVYDQIGFQQAISKFYSIHLANIATFGYQNVRVDKDANVSVNDLASGIRLFQTNTGTKIEGINLTNIPPEVTNTTGMFEKKVEQLSGLNSVVRGNPEASLKSGTALALVASQAISFLSSLEESYIQFQQDVATGIIDLLKVYATTPRLVAVAGKANASIIQTEFTKDDIDGISRVRVQRANPLSKTAAGRVELAEFMLDKGMIMPQDYLNVLTTGQTDSIMEAETGEVTLVQEENEKLREGGDAPVLESDNHKYHIKMHSTLLNNPVLRYEPELVDSVLAHIAEHKKFEGGGASPAIPMPGDAAAGGGAQPPAPPVLNPQAGPPLAPPMELQGGEQVTLPGMPELPPGTPPEMMADYEQLKG